MRTRSIILAAAASAFACTSALAQMPPSYDFDFVTIGAPGNAPFHHSASIWPVHGRGGVNYGFRIARYEITTGQWLEFMNTFATQAGTPVNIWGPIHWGAEPDPSYTGPGRRYVLSNIPDAAMLPVEGIPWNDAARFCNWLHNGKSSDLSSLETGAYDASIFTTPLTQLPPALRTRSPGAQFWIPSLDEWIKAAHYDPHRYGPGQEGWWLNKNMSDLPGIPGPPGVGQTSAGWLDPHSSWGHWEIPLGAYTGSQSPWGLFDTSGGAAEWIEEVFGNERGHAGSFAGDSFYEFWDYIYGIGSAHTTSTMNSFRIASQIPSPGTAAGLLIGTVFSLNRRRR
jgi:formylglycine-generating enzyme required for sulfatase activity